VNAVNAFGWRWTVKQSLGHAPVGIVFLKNRTISLLPQLFIENCSELAKQLVKKSGKLTIIWSFH